MRVAFATTDAIHVDEHFGRCGIFAVYELSEDRCEFVEMRKFAEGRDTAIEETKGAGQLHDDRVEAKVDRLSDCRIVYLTEIGGPSAAKFVKKGMMPLKVKGAVSIDEALEELGKKIKDSPPPWLKKALNNNS